jgi:hypothetical protein
VKFLAGLIVGVVCTGLLIDRGVDLPNRIKQLINANEIERLYKDIERVIIKK